jgi:hypothetical protein
MIIMCQLKMKKICENWIYSFKISVKLEHAKVLGRGPARGVRGSLRARGKKDRAGSCTPEDV